MERAMNPLTGVRVVDVGSGIATAYATKLLADAGADVVLVEPADGDPLRHWSATGAHLGGSDGALFRHLSAGKRSVVGDADALIGSADIVVESGGADPEALRSHDPRLVVVSVTPYGRTGPYADRPATDFTIQAECGSIAGRGIAARPPVAIGGRIAEWSAGVFAAFGALAALRRALRTGEGAHVDASWVEAMTVATNLYSDLMWSLLGRPPVPYPGRSVETPSIYPSKDGWVGFNTNGPQHFAAFTELIERPDLREGDWPKLQYRLTRYDEFEAAVQDWIGRHTSAEILARAGELRVPTARVNDGASVLDEEQLVARDFFVPDATGTFRQPSPHYRIDGVRPPTGRPAPQLGEHTISVEARDRATPFGEPADALPLDGVRVVDLTAWWAGPATTQLLGALGADVVHVESAAHPDPMRYAAATMFLDREQWWEYSSFYLAVNTNKRGVTLDLSRPEGLELIRKLVEWADVLVENYTPRVMPKFGLDWDAVHALNPRAVMVRMPAYGLDGPWADRLGFAQTTEQMTGMAWVTGHPDGPPLVPRGPCDPVGGAHAAIAALAGLAQRDATGAGVLVEVPLVEGGLNLTAEQVVEHTAYGRTLMREGNRAPHAAPQGLYACAGDEQWLAVSVATDAQWAALARAVGRDDWAGDAALSSLAGRRAAHDQLDAGLAEWAATRELEAAVEVLLESGVPAAAALDPRLIHTHPHLLARGYLEPVDHPVVGEHLVPGVPFRMSGVDRWLTPAPTMGQHNADVLGGLLGLSADEIAALAASGVIGTAPPART